MTMHPRYANGRGLLMLSDLECFMSDVVFFSVKLQYITCLPLLDER